MPALLQASADDDGVGPYPDGTWIPLAAPDADAVLSAWLGKEVQLVEAGPNKAVGYEMTFDPPNDGAEYYAIEAPPGTFLDATAGHVVTLTTLRRTAERRPDLDWDVRRFRPNLVVDGDPGTLRRGRVSTPDPAGRFGRTSPSVNPPFAAPCPCGPSPKLTDKPRVRRPGGAAPQPPGPLPRRRHSRPDLRRRRCHRGRLRGEDGASRWGLGPRPVALSGPARVAAVAWVKRLVPVRIPTPSAVRIAGMPLVLPQVGERRGHSYLLCRLGAPKNETGTTPGRGFRGYVSQDERIGGEHDAVDRHAVFPHLQRQVVAAGVEGEGLGGADPSPTVARGGIPSSPSSSGSPSSATSQAESDRFHRRGRPRTGPGANRRAHTW